MTQDQNFQTLKHFETPDFLDLVAAQVQVLQLVQRFDALHRDQAVRAQVQVHQRLESLHTLGRRELAAVHHSQLADLVGGIGA